MIIVWGSKVRYEEEGYGALFCSLCRDLMPVKIESIYRVPHVYYIPLGGGDKVASRAVCTACGTWFEPNNRMVRKAMRSPGRDFAALIAETNPEYLPDLAERIEMEYKVRTAPQTLTDEERTGLTVAAMAGSSGALLEKDSAEALKVIGVLLAIVGAIIVPLICWSDSHQHPNSSQIGNWAISILSILVGGGLCTLFFLWSGKVGRKPKVLRKLARALAPINPPLELLDAGLAFCKSRNLPSGKLCSPNRLYDEIRMARDQMAASNPDYPPFSCHYEEVLETVRNYLRGRPPEGTAPAADAPAPAEKSRASARRQKNKDSDWD